jgi:hypothetical protein
MDDRRERMFVSRYQSEDELDLIVDDNDNCTEYSSIGQRALAKWSPMPWKTVHAVMESLTVRASTILKNLQHLITYTTSILQTLEANPS